MKETVYDLVQFTWTVLTYWQGSPFAAIVTGAVGVFEKVRNKSLGKRTYVGLFVGLYLFFGFFLAWRDERVAHRETQNTIRELTAQLNSERDKSKPKLEGEIYQVGVGNDETGQAQAFILLSVRNLGAPSIVDGWPLMVELPGGEKLNLIPSYIPDGYRILGDKGEVTAEFKREDTFEEKALKPIATGDKITGWLRYFVPKQTSRRLIEDGVTFSISFQDVLKQPYHAVHVMTGKLLDPLMYYPGGGTPFKRPVDTLPNMPSKKQRAHASKRRH